MIYNDLEKNDNIVLQKPVDLSINFVYGAFVEIKGDSDRDFNVEFIDKKTVKFEHGAKIKSNMWVKANKQYFVDWLIRVNGREFHYDVKGRRVYITIESMPLGDVLAWFPYIEEFRKKHDCQIVCSSYHNHLFVDQYPHFEFLPMGSTAHDIVAMYSIGWFFNDDLEFDPNRSPTNLKTQPLQKTAADILGIHPFVKIKPLLKLPIVQKKKKVGIAIHSTCQAKYWNNPDGWGHLTKRLIEYGYEVVLLSKEEDGYMGNSHPEGVRQLPSGSIEDLIKELCECEFFVGIGSGLSWLSWACNIPTVIISGFSEPYTEPVRDNIHVIRIASPEGVCSGCFNNRKFDKHDWNWCPDHKGTDRQFECTKTITPEYVFGEIYKHFLTA